MLKCDVAILGAGTAGLSAERSARRAGARTLLIDESFSGTTCATVGCMPSKLLIAAGNAAAAVHHASLFGIKSTALIDGPAVMNRVRRERDGFAAATRAAIDKLPDGIKVRGTASFLDANTLLLEDGRRIQARSVVIATGSRPSIPTFLSHLQDRVLTNETVFELTTLPASLAVVGAGPLGLELAQSFARLGVAVVVFAENHALGGITDSHMLERMVAAFSREFELHLGVQVEATADSRQISLAWKGDSVGQRGFDQVLSAAGRPPDLRRLRLDATGLELDKRGVPAHDPATLQCGTHGIFIAGDATAERPVLHEADTTGAIAGANAASYPQVNPVHRPVALSIMFTEPPLAVIGEHAEIIGESDYRKQGRARVEGRAEGLAQIYAKRDEGVLTGATLFCPGADHLAHLLAWAIEGRLGADAMLDLPFYHPTFEEGLQPALREICEQVGIAPPSVRDMGSAPGT